MDAKKVGLCYVDRMPCEAAAAAVMSLLEPTACCAFTRDQTKDPESLTRLVESRKFESLILLGGYWADRDALKTLLTKYPAVKVWGYFPTPLPPEYDQFAKSALVYHPYSSPEKVGPCTFLVSLLRREFPCTSELFWALLRQPHCSEITRQVDDRQFQQNMAENQVLFSGVFEYPGLAELPTTFGKFRKLLVEPPSCYNAVVLYGKGVIEHNLKLVSERVRNNSGIFMLQDCKTKAVVSTAPELVNLTHEALCELYQGEAPDVSITLTYNFGNPSGRGTSVQNVYSIRSYVKQVSAEDLAKKLGGGGDAKSAGASVPIPEFKLGL